MKRWHRVGLLCLVWPWHLWAQEAPWTAWVSWVMDGDTVLLVKPGQDEPENTQIRLSDGVVIFTDQFAQLGDARVWPVSRQIALKFLRSPLLVNPQIVNKLRGRADTALTWDDVVVHLDLT